MFRPCAKFAANAFWRDPKMTDGFQAGFARSELGVVPCHQVTDGTARGPTQRAPRRRRGEGRLDRIAASKREPPSRPQRPRTAAKPFCVSCFRAETEDRRKGSCATSATQESTRPLSRRSRPTDCPGDRSGPTKDGGELTSKPRRRHAPQLNSQAPIVFLSILQANENLSAPW